MHAARSALVKQLRTRCTDSLCIDCLIVFLSRCNGCSTVGKNTLLLTSNTATTSLFSGVNLQTMPRGSSGGICGSVSSAASSLMRSTGNLWALSFSLLASCHVSFFHQFSKRPGRWQLTTSRTKALMSSLISRLFLLLTSVQSFMD